MLVASPQSRINLFPPSWSNIRFLLLVSAAALAVYCCSLVWVFGLTVKMPDSEDKSGALLSSAPLSSSAVPCLHCSFTLLHISSAFLLSCSTVQCEHTLPSTVLLYHGLARPSHLSLPESADPREDLGL